MPIPTAEKLLCEIRNQISDVQLPDELLVFILKYGMHVRRKALVEAAKAVCEACEEEVPFACSQPMLLHETSVQFPHFSRICSAMEIHDLLAKLEPEKWMADVRDWAKGHPQGEQAVDDSRDANYEPEVKGGG